MQQQSQSEEEPSHHRSMAEHRLYIERDLRLQRERAAAAATSFAQSLHAIKSLADETLASREKLAKLKDHLKETEANLGDTLTMKACKEAKCTTIAESLATTTARIEQLKRMVQDQIAKKNEYAAVLSNQLPALETLKEKSNQYTTGREKIEKAIMWYNRVLGFRTEGGEGVKFIFNKINPKNPDEEYSFTVRLDGDIYTLLDCDPNLDGASGLVKDLNKSHDLFKFVRIMREKFKLTTANEALSTSTSIIPESVMVSSPPPTSMDNNSESPQLNGNHLQSMVNRRNPQKGVRDQIASPSPRSVSALRRSPRLLHIPFTFDDISKSMKEIDISDVDPPLLKTSSSLFKRSRSLLEFVDSYADLMQSHLIALVSSVLCRYLLAQERYC